MPLKLVRGVIGKLRISIPWRKILFAPCKIYISDIHVFCTTAEGLCKGYYKDLKRDLKSALVKQLLKGSKKEQQK